MADVYQKTQAKRKYEEIIINNTKQSLFIGNKSDTKLMLQTLQIYKSGGKK